MRAITVRQPWAWAIIHGGKDVENRTRNIAGAYRGPVAIHAATADAKIAYWQYRQLVAAGWPRYEEQPHGVILGVADLVDVHAGETNPDAPACSPWALHEYQHLVLANPRPLAEPIPWRGALGLWTLPDDVLDAAEVRA